jgi:hypothetical protein
VQKSEFCFGVDLGARGSDDRDQCRRQRCNALWHDA